MNTKLRRGIFHLTKYILFFFIMFSQSFAFDQEMRLKDNDFKENLAGRWEGNWYWGSISAKERIKIIKIDGDKVHLSGYMEGGPHPDTDEVYGRIENSSLLLTWPAAKPLACEEEYTMKRDDSNKLILDGNYKCGSYTGKVQLKKIE